MLTIKASQRLYLQAKNWLTKFPHHVAGPEIAGAWLQASDSADAAEFAAHYMSQPSSCDELHPVFRAIFNTSRREVLWKLVRELLEAHPSSDAWRRSIFLLPDKADVEMERLALRWITLNMGNPDFPGLSLASSDSPMIVEKTFEWITTAGQKGAFMPFALSSLLTNQAIVNQESFVSTLVGFTRSWVRANSDNESVSMVIADLIMLTQSQLDIAYLKEWYEGHRSNERSWLVISGLLEYANRTRIEPDSFAISEAKVILRGQRPAERVPRLLEILVTACNDEESRTLVKEACSKTEMFWVLATLILFAPDEESIEMAHKSFDRWVGTPIELRLFVGLLRAGSNDERIIKRARYWLRRNKDDEDAERLREVLNARKRRSAQ